MARSVTTERIYGEGYRLCTTVLGAQNGENPHSVTLVTSPLWGETQKIEFGEG
jgi:hypothetical protein